MFSVNHVVARFRQSEPFLKTKLLRSIASQGPALQVGLSGASSLQPAVVVPFCTWIHYHWFSLSLLIGVGFFPKNDVSW